MGEVDSINAVESASKVLSPELRQKSFALAARIIKITQETRTTNKLAKLSSKLLINKKIADKTIDSIFKNS
jgi:predicted solute-binding protein